MSASDLWRQAREMEKARLSRRGKAGKAGVFRTLKRTLKLVKRRKKERAGELGLRFFEQGHIPAAFRQQIIKDLRAFSENEATLYPSAAYLAKFELYKRPSRPELGQAYVNLVVELTSDQYDYIILAPWLKRGGADKGIIQFCDIYRQLGRTLLIVTEDAASEWLHQVPADVEVLRFYRDTRKQKFAETKLLLIRLLLQLGPKVIHIIQSNLAWATIADFHKQIHSSGTKILASVFCDELTRKGNRIGYAISYLPHCVEALDLVLTDNNPYRLHLEKVYAGFTDKFGVAHFWHDQADVLERRKPEARLVLWTGRLCWQKRLDMLLHIAEARPDFKFLVYGYADQEKETIAILRALQRLPNVSVKGPFDGLSSIPELPTASCLLYTTRSDGLPNVLLESAAAMVPIVAPPTVGGLSDFISSKTAWCVDDPECVESYLEALDECLNAQDDTRVREAYKLLGEQHSRTQFEANVRQFIRRLQG